MRTALITGLQGPALTRDEAAFLKDVRPAASSSLRAIWIARPDPHAPRRRADGRLGREPPHSDRPGRRARAAPAASARARVAAGGAYAQAYARDPAAATAAAFAVGQLTAADLRALGINTNCLPVLDLPVSGATTSSAIAPTARTTEQVVALAGAVAEGHHGRRRAAGDQAHPRSRPRHRRQPPGASGRDREPRQAEATDFAPFKALHALPAAMTAHVVFSAIDADAPASTSAA